MLYLEIVEEVIPEILDQALEGLRMHLIEILGQQKSVIDSLLTCKTLLTHYSDIPPPDDTQDEECNFKPTEQYAVQSLQFSIIQRPPSPIKRQISSKATTMLSMKMKKQPSEWKFQNEPIPLTEVPPQEDHDIEKLRRIKLQQLTEQRKQQQLKDLREQEAKRLREMHRKAIQQSLNRKDFTYDYNCEPLVKQAVHHNSLVHQINFALSKSTQRKNINESNRVQTLKTHQSIKQSKQTTQANQEEYECQTSNLQHINLQHGVKITEQNKQAIGENSLSPLARITKQQYQQLTNQQKLMHFIGFIQYKPSVPMTHRETEIPEIEKQRSSHVEEILRQGVIQLPKLRSHSMNQRTKINRSFAQEY